MNKTSHFSLRRLVQGLLLALLAAWVVPVQAQNVYWVDAVSGYINYRAINGTGSTTILVTGGVADPDGHLWGIASDANNVYFSDTHGYIGIKPIGIGAATYIDLRGAGLTGAEPAGVATDGQYIYWADPTTGCIGRANIDGTLPDGQSTFESFITGLVSPYSIKVNGSNIFWVTGPNVYTASYSGTTVGTPYFLFTVPTSVLWDLAVESTKIYVADNTNSKIRRATFGGTTSDTLTAALDSFSITTTSSPGSVAVANYVYWGGGAGMGRDLLNGTLAGSDGLGSLGDGVFITSTGWVSGITITNAGTVITLTSFTATPTATQVKVAWQTGSEVDTAGFNIWRSATATGTFSKVNAAVIPANGSGVGGASYSWTDTTVGAGQTWYYKLEDIDSYGASTLHGPVSATVGATSLILSFQATPSDIFLGGGSLLNWTVNGSPALSIAGLGPVSASSLWVAPQTSTSYTLADGLGNQNLTTVNVKPFALLDMPGLSKAWGSSKGDANYNPSYDLNGDGKVDDADVALCFKGL